MRRRKFVPAISSVSGSVKSAALRWLRARPDVGAKPQSAPAAHEAAAAWPKNPYTELPERAYWRRAVANRQVGEIKALFDGVPGFRSAKFATAGSCFAQHLGRALRNNGLNYMDYEPPPPFLFEKRGRSRRIRR